MAAARKVIITCAVTGSGHTPTMSPHLPYTVEDVVAQSVAAAQAGAAVIHLHARDPKDGSPTADPAVFLEYLKAIKSEISATFQPPLESVRNFKNAYGVSTSMKNRWAVWSKSSRPS